VVEDAGLSEIARFLALRPPFDALASEELGDVAAQTQIEFHLPGAVILSEDGGPVTFLRVIHSGAVDIWHEGKLLDLLGLGDTFGPPRCSPGCGRIRGARRRGHALLPGPGGRREALAGAGEVARARGGDARADEHAGRQADPHRNRHVLADGGD
jgi:hypothetical protein